MKRTWKSYVWSSLSLALLSIGYVDTANAQFFSLRSKCDWNDVGCDEYRGTSQSMMGGYSMSDPSGSAMNGSSPSGSTQSESMLGSSMQSGSMLGGDSTSFGSSDPSSLRGLNLISGSTPGSSFAALAPNNYIDSAILMNAFRLRFDAGFNNRFPDRAEFFYGQCGCFGPGAPGPLLPETKVDYQEFQPYMERKLNQRFSVFLEAPIRAINPEVNPNEAGFGDLNTGFKRSIYAENNQFLTAQFRVYAPTGNAFKGLGTGHASLEPSILYMGRWSDRMTTFSEFRVWIPISDNAVGGQNFSGPILRYGIGAGYDLLNMDTRSQRRRLTGTLETVGWTITDGLALDGPAGAPFSVSGDTIVNVKPGMRYVWGNHSIASSYGVAVTGDKWYSDIFRLEYRRVY